MAHDGAQQKITQARSLAADSSLGECEYSLQLTKADLDESLSTMYDKIAQQSQSELHESTNTLSLEIAALGSRTDLLEIYWSDTTPSPH